MPKPWVELKEARGRTVKRMNVAYDEEYVAVEVEFEDGHSMNVDIIPAVQIRPQFQHVSTGDARIIRSYKSRISVAGGLKINPSSEAD
ncbi:MAG: hypothetical protein ACLP6G_10360 [Terriglobales bacterium]|jgi:hypothetical protein